MMVEFDPLVYDMNLQLTLSKDKMSSSSLLHALAQSPHVMVRCDVCSHSNTSKETLQELSFEKNSEVLSSLVYRKKGVDKDMLLRILDTAIEEEYYVVVANIATRKTCPKVVLNTTMKIAESIVNDKNRLKVANILRLALQNENIPIAYLSQHYSHPVMDVRRSVAANPNTPPDILAKLAEDEASVVADNAIANPSCPSAVLLDAANEADTKKKIYIIASNSNAPEEALGIIYHKAVQFHSPKSRQTIILRRLVVSHPNAPQWLKEINSLVE